MSAAGRLVRCAGALSLSAALIAGVTAIGAGTAWADDGGAGGGGGGAHGLYVSPTGTPANHGRSCADAAYSTIQSAVNAAGVGSTVVVCHGTYTEDVTVPEALTLLSRNATIDATGLNNGVTILASSVDVEGFTIKNAIGEGILASPSVFPPAGPPPPPISNVSIRDNVIDHNDQGFGNFASPYFECGPQYADCGEGIHLISVSNSQVSGNSVTHNAGGVLLTDELGPNHGNVISDNLIANNATECGITLPSHNGGAATFDPTTFAVTGVNPTVGGVFGNVVRDNVVLNNGTNLKFGGGAGVGIFAPFPGTASYNNTVEDNTMSGNGLAGVAVHSHAPGQYVSGNSIIDNVIGKNNIAGDSDTAEGGFAPDLSTTGILVLAVASPLTITIAHNVVVNDTYGIWLNANNVTASGLTTNHFFGVTTPIFSA